MAPRRLWSLERERACGVLGPEQMDYETEPEEERGVRGQAPRRRGRRRASVVHVAAVLVVSLILVATWYSGGASPSVVTHSKRLVQDLNRHAARAQVNLLRVFQVYPPVLGPESAQVRKIAKELASAALGERDVSKRSQRATDCQKEQMLMQHVFGDSYEKPFVGQYTPPPCNFNRVTFKLTVTSAGRQFDRLGVVYFGDTEIWRTSTAEPTQEGIEWTYEKDMSNYLSLFQKPQTLIFDLGNLINNIYTASFDATLTATFFNGPATVVPADLILPVSRRKGAGGEASAFQYPKMRAKNSLSLPRNVRRAVFTMSATGQLDEEFWFANVLSSYTDTFGSGNLPGYSAFREVQLLIDGSLAGVAWPFPVIFTGGIVPGLWRPIVGIDAFDLRENEIDITPWLPMLCDGKSHTFEIKVAGINDNGSGQGELTDQIGSYWVLTGKVFMWLDPEGSVTSGSQVTREAPPPSIILSGSSQGLPIVRQNLSLVNNVDVSRRLMIMSTVKTAQGSFPSFWSQDLGFSNEERFIASGATQFTKSLTQGLDLSSSGYARRINYPLDINTIYVVTPKTLSIIGHLSRAQTIHIAGEPVFPTGLHAYEAKSSLPNFQGTELHTTQDGVAHYTSNRDGSDALGFGMTSQNLDFTAFRSSSKPSADSFPTPSDSTPLYSQRVSAANDSVTHGGTDGGEGPPHTQSLQNWSAGQGQYSAMKSLKRMLRMLDPQQSAFLAALEQTS